MAFHPMPLPTCPDTNDSSTDAESIAAGKCKIEATMAMGYNSAHGKLPDAISACAGIMDELMANHISYGQEHDSRVAICTQAALHMGIIGPLF
jgi:hypothetical protein